MPSSFRINPIIAVIRCPDPGPCKGLFEKYSMEGNDLPRMNLTRWLIANPNDPQAAEIRTMAMELSTKTGRYCWQKRKLLNVSYFEIKVQEVFIMKKTFLIGFVAVILWVVLASMDAGLLGFGVVLSAVAFFDIVTGEFKDNGKMVWLIVALFSMLVGVIGIAFKESSVSAGNNPAYTLSTVFSLLLPLAYFTMGRKNRFQNEKK